MSSIPTKQIDGDVAVGRDVNIGGKATIRGSAKVGHNLTVDGWLEAKNIKGPNKGLFKTAAQLREAYPNPHEGWWTLVTVEGSAASDHLGQLYVADGGVWVAQVDGDGKPQLKGNPTIDSTEYNKAVEEMTTDLKAVKADVDQNKEDVRSLRSTQTTQGESINTLTTKMGDVQGEVNSIMNGVGDMQGRLEELKDSKGKADGLAPLDENGQISSQYLPGYVDDVLEIGGLINGLTAQMVPVQKKSTDENCAVVYDADKNVYVIRIVTDEQATYYVDWTDGELFGVKTDAGRKPHGGKIYMDVTTNKSYRWSGTKLAPIASDLALGHTSGTAYPGNEGVQLNEEVKKNQKELQAVNKRIEGISILPFDGVWNGNGKAPNSGLWYAPSPGHDGEWCFRRFGDTTTEGYGYAEEDYNADGVGRADHIYRCEDELYHIVDKKMQKMGGSNGSSASIYNPTVEQGGHYYVLCDTDDTANSAVHAAKENGKATVGLMITFALKKGTWKTYQYIGANTEDSNWYDTENWKDFGSMVQGSEPMIDIDIIPHCLQATTPLAPHLPP